MIREHEEAATLAAKLAESNLKLAKLNRIDPLTQVLNRRAWEECAAIVQGTVEPMGHVKTIFPAPGGGMSLDRVPEMLETYGRDLIFLIGGGLFKHGQDLVENCRYFRRMVEGF